MRLKDELLGILFVCTFAFGSHAQAEIDTVSFVDPSRYLGDWYQIAHIPLFFEGGTCACTRQRLTLNQSSSIDVYNSCNDQNPSGELREIRGTATNDDPQSNAKYTVDFGFPWKGTYWIVGLDSEYRYATVTDKNGHSLYILSKTQTLSQALYDEAVQIASDKNLDVGKLEVTNHTGCSYPQ